MAGEAPSENWFRRNPGKGRLVLLLVALVFAECGLRFVSLFGLAPYSRYPTTEYWAHHPIYGVWRHPNSSLRFQQLCVDAQYESNSYGARDSERARKSDAKTRVVVLGASLAEGYGIDKDKRWSELLEERTGIEHLNFGTSGGFSSIQEWLLYDDLAKEFDHSHIFIFFVPFNDFAENKPGSYPDDSYRPYLRKTPDGFEVFYTVSFEDRRKNETLTTLKLLANHVTNTFYVANGLRWAFDHLRAGEAEPRDERPTGEPIASYDRYTPEDLEILFYSYDQIIRLAPDKQIYIFSLPFDGGDFVKVAQSGYDFPLVEEMQRFANERPNVHYVDLLRYFVAYAEEHDLHYRDFELGCNRHWGEVGHRAAAEAIYDAVWSKSNPGS